MALCGKSSVKHNHFKTENHNTLCGAPLERGSLPIHRQVSLHWTANLPLVLCNTHKVTTANINVSTIITNELNSRN